MKLPNTSQDSSGVSKPYRAAECMMKYVNYWGHKSAEGIRYLLAYSELMLMVTNEMDEMMAELIKKEYQSFIEETITKVLNEHEENK